MTTPNTIFQAAAKVYKCTLQEIYGKSQKRHIADARRMAYLIIREETKLSYRQIAAHLGRTTHTGILDMVKKAKGYMQTDWMFSHRNTQVYSKLTEIKRQRRNKQRYNAHYRLRKKGFRVSSYDRTIWMPASKLNGHEPAEFKTLRKHGYSIQLTLDQL
jgi:transposase